MCLLHAVFHRQTTCRKLFSKDCLCGGKHRAATVPIFPLSGLLDSQCGPGEETCAKPHQFNCRSLLQAISF